jgi:hypothetical protein
MLLNPDEHTHIFEKLVDHPQDIGNSFSMAKI